MLKRLLLLALLSPLLSAQALAVDIGVQDFYSLLGLEQVSTVPVGEVVKTRVDDPTKLEAHGLTLPRGTKVTLHHKAEDLWVATLPEGKKVELKGVHKAGELKIEVEVRDCY